MAKLTAKARNKLPAAAFAGPGRSYPVKKLVGGKLVPDPRHAAAAKGFAAMHHSPDKARIDAKADKVLGKGKKGK